MAVVVNTERGHDASYPFKTTGGAAGPVITGQRGADSCLSAMEKGGEPAGIRRLEFELAYRPASTGRAIAQFSSHRAQTTKPTLALAGQCEKDRGHALDRRTPASMGRSANVMMRRAKGPGALNFAALLRGWERPSYVARA